MRHCTASLLDSRILCGRGERKWAEGLTSYVSKTHIVLYLIYVRTQHPLWISSCRTLTTALVDSSSPTKIISHNWVSSAWTSAQTRASTFATPQTSSDPESPWPSCGSGAISPRSGLFWASWPRSSSSWSLSWFTRSARGRTRFLMVRGTRLWVFLLVINIISFWSA